MVVSDYSTKIKKSAMETIQALGFLVQFIIYSTIIIVSSIVLDKENKIVPRILSSPMSMTNYLAQHFASYLVMSTINSLIVMLTLRFLFGYSFYGHFLIMLYMLILFSVSMIAFSIMVLSICKKSKIFYWVMICMATPLVMVGGCYFDVNTMPEFVQNISNFIPTTWIMKIAKEVLENNNLDNISTTVIVLLHSLYYL